MRQSHYRSVKDFLEHGWTVEDFERADWDRRAIEPDHLVTSDQEERLRLVWRRHQWNRFRILTFWLVGIFAVCCIVFVIVQNYRLNRDIDALMDRAQVGANATDILEYLQQLEKNMRYWEMTRGHTAVIFRTPSNDMALHYKAIQRLIDRLKEIKDLPRNETTYQVALDDIRGTIRELPDPAGGWAWVKYEWWMCLIALVIGATIFWLEHKYGPPRYY